jgi:succinate dehydrogenase/fumarate reductase cytochrome b subunit
MRLEPRIGWRSARRSTCALGGLRCQRLGAARRAHGLSALIIVAFALLHLANHLVALAGVEAHAAFMLAARQVYRQPVVEGVLLMAVAFQVGSGLVMLATRRWPRAPLARLQSAAGAVLAFFLLVHVGAVLGARNWLGLDTTFHFAAAGFHVDPWSWFFAPYYAAAVVALFVHLGCAAQRRWGGAGGSLRWVGVAAAAGSVVALLIVGCLAGVLIEVDVPAPYLAPYGVR